jgi:anti-sigma-K factor RskA
MTTDANHDGLRELVAPYAIGALAAPERAAFEAHVRQCAECAAELAAFLPVSSALAQLVPQRDPPPALRARILAAAGATPAATRTRTASAAFAVAPWLAAAAMLALTAGLAVYVGELRERVRSLELQLREALVRVDDGERRIAVALRTAADAQAPLVVLTAADLRRIDLAGQPVAPAASARAFWSRSRGLVLTGSNLPPLPPGRIYQLWFVSARAPVSAGLIAPDNNGQVRTVLNTPADLPDPVALAVTLEPEGGVPAPTGDKYLVGLAH